MHLVGLVVAGQHIHHDVDAGAEGHFPLHLVGGDDGSTLAPFASTAQAPSRSLPVIMIG